MRVPHEISEAVQRTAYDRHFSPFKFKMLRILKRNETNEKNTRQIYDERQLQLKLQLQR